MTQQVLSEIPPDREGWHRVWTKNRSDRLRDGYTYVYADGPNELGERAVQRFVSMGKDEKLEREFLLEIPEAKYQAILWKSEPSDEPQFAEKPEGALIRGFSDDFWDTSQPEVHRKPPRFTVRLDWRGVTLAWDKTSALWWGTLRISWWPPRVRRNFDSQQKLMKRLREGDAMLAEETTRGN